MDRCQNCGNVNSPNTNFCRFCGTKLGTQSSQPTPDPYGHGAPTPYGWKTDDSLTKTDARRTFSSEDRRPTQFEPVNLAGNAIYGSQNTQPNAPMVQQGMAMDPGYRCPNCGTSYLPQIEKRISTPGWIVFATLLVFTFIFFWIGLLMKEEVAICPVCKFKVG